MKRLIILLCAALLTSLTSCLSPESRMARGDDFYLQGRFELALRDYQLARRNDPTLPGIDEKIGKAQIRVYLDRGDKCTQKRRWDAAAQAYEEVRRLDPANAEVDERLARLAVARGNHHFGRGQELMARGNPFDAVAEFEQALVFQPDHPRAAMSLEHARQSQKEHEARAEVSYQSGVRARDAGRFEAALRDFAKALEQNPHHVGAKLGRQNAESALVDALIRDGDAATAAGRYREALVAYQKAQRRAPGRSGLASRIHRVKLEVRAADLVAEGDRALAQKHWRQAFARFDEARRLTAEPEPLLARFGEARNGFAAELYGAAFVDEREGRYEDALTRYGAIVSFHPGYRDASTRHRTLHENLAKVDVFYQAGCRAQEACDLVSARDQFRACVVVLAAYRDAAKRLHEVSDSLSTAERLYRRATKAETRREFPRARLLYEECLAIVHPFRDASDRLVGLQRRHADAEVPGYEDGCRFQAERNLHKALESFHACEDSQHGYRDTHDRLRDVKAALARAGDVHRRGVAAEKACQLGQARDLYLKCLAICTPYSDAQARLDSVVASLRMMREARRLYRARKLLVAQKRYQDVLRRHGSFVAAQKRVQEIDGVCKKLTQRYETMVAAERAGRFRLALCEAHEIRKVCVEFRDVDTRIAMLESQADYADGRTLQEQGRHAAAARCYERCASRHPGFRDVRERVRKCKLILPATPPRRR